MIRVKGADLSLGLMVANVGAEGGIQDVRDPGGDAVPVSNRTRDVLTSQRLGGAGTF